MVRASLPAAGRQTGPEPNMVQGWLRNLNQCMISKFYLFAFYLFLPSGEEDPEFLSGPWREIEKMNSTGNGLFKEVQVHLFDLFVAKASRLGYFHNGKRLSQFNLNSLHLEGVIKIFFL